MGSLGFDWDIHEVKQDKEKGVIAGKFLGKINTKTMIAPGQSITIKKRKRRVRCLDLKENKKIAIVE